MKKVIIFLVLLVSALPLFSEEKLDTPKEDLIELDTKEIKEKEDISLINEKETYPIYTPTVGQHFAAFGEALASNLVLMGVNRYIRKAPYAYVTWDSMYKNLTNPWVWDQDGFAVNHIGHPYQGSYYYIAGRSSNLPFWESALVGALGSLTWELFAETETPSYNDVIVTPIAGMAVGEMLHRLYFEAKDINGLFSFIVSPMSAINNMFYGGKLNRPESHVTSLSTKLILGAVIDKIEFTEHNVNGPSDFIPLYLGGGLNIVYGNPYGLETKTPYDQFDLDIKFSLSKDYYNVSIFSDGMLFSFSPWEQDKLKTTMGMSLHYDFLMSTTMNYSANALGFTTKQHAILPKDWDIKWDLHLNGILMSANDFYLLFKDYLGQDIIEENRDYDLGTGVGFKTSFNLSHPLFGSLYLFYFLDFVKTITNSVPKYGSTGTALIGVGSIAYDHQIYKNLSLGLEYSSYIKSAHYKTSPNLMKHNQFLNIYLKYLYD